MERIIVIIRDSIKSFILSLLSLIRIIFFSRVNSLKLNSQRQERDLLIIANGPSVSVDQQNILELSKSSDCLMVNLAPTTELFQLIEPKYLVLAAPEFWIKEVDSKYIDQAKKLFIELSDNTRWPLILLIPNAARKYKSWQKIIDANKHISVRYVNNTPLEGFQFFRNFLFDLRLGMPRPHNVVIPSIMAGIWLEYQQILLVGVDHSWLPEISVDDDNNVLINHKHYYNEDVAKPTSMGKLGRGKRKLHEVLQKFIFTFESYHVINEYSRVKGINITNLTSGSFIDAFKRSTIEELKRG